MMLFKGNSSKLELLIEKIHSTREGGLDGGDTRDEVSVGTSSWDAGSDGRGSLSPASSVTPTSAPDTDVEAACTLGVTQTTPYLCSFCDKAFPRLSYLKRHEQSHADQLPFRCEFCGRHFKHKRSRDRHVKLHTGDKKYKCTHCDAAFSRSDHLKIHLKTHDTQKPYQCSVCNRGYNTAAALTAHMQSHKAKLTAHALNHLLKEAGSPQVPKESVQAFSQILKDTTLAKANPNVLDQFLRNSKESESTLDTTPKMREAESPGSEPPMAVSPMSILRCPLCHVHCKNHNHLQHHLVKHHNDDSGASSERPASTGGASAASSTGGGVPSAASSPSPRPSSAISSPRSLSNPLLTLISGKLSCPYCNRETFGTLDSLQLHVHSVHSDILTGSLINGELRDATNLLGLSASMGSTLTAESLLSPLTTAGSSRQVSCELCGARVAGVAALQRHVVTAHTFTDLLARAAEGVFCAQCLLPFSNPGALAEHIKLVHTAPSSMLSVFPKRAQSPSRDMPTDLSKKSRMDPTCSAASELPATTLLCNQCNAPFSNFEAFRSHLKCHLEGGDPNNHQLICPECRLPLASESALEVHLSTHLATTTTEYGCQACLKLFSKPDELQKHLMDIHAHHLFRCALCKEMFDSKVSIQVHFAVKHSNECKVYKCTRCALIFRSQSEFEIHVRVAHLRRNKHQSSQSNHHSRTNQHQQTQIGGYRCLLCPLSLATESELTAHISTHQRKFQCSLCDEAFHIEFLLDKHMQNRHNSELNGNIPKPENLAKSRHSPQKDLRCGICDSEFSNEASLITHRKQVHNMKSNNLSGGAKVAAATLSLFCAYCSEACKSRADLEAHMKTHQGSGGRHKCNICDELCPSAAILAQHKLSHIKVMSGSTCAICRESLTSAEEVSHHQSDHHPAPLPQPCVVCRQTLVTDIELNVHSQFHAAQAAALSANGSNSIGEQHTASRVISDNSISAGNGNNSRQSSPILHCSECKVKLENSEEAETHRALHHSMKQRIIQNSAPRSYQCIKCQESFASESEIESHVASHLLHEGSCHECHLCRANFDTPLKLQCHLIEHTFEGCSSFTCYMCSSVFTTATRLQQHMVEHGLSARPYDCHHCHLRFFFRAELENHLLSHTEASDGSCQECKSSFSGIIRQPNTRQSLTCSSSCPFCPYIAHSISDLHSHALRYHSGESLPISQASIIPQPSQDKSYNCLICGKHFKTSQSLHFHGLTHKDESPYLCYKCGSGFSKHCEAKSHANSHKGDDPEICAQCNLTVTPPMTLITHINDSHNNRDTYPVRPESVCSSCVEEVPINGIKSPKMEID